MLAALGRYIPIQHSDVIEGVLNRRLLHNSRACWHFAPANLLYKYFNRRLEGFCRACVYSRQGSTAYIHVR